MDPRGDGIGSDRFASGVEGRLPLLPCSAAARGGKHGLIAYRCATTRKQQHLLQAAEGWPQLRRAFSYGKLAQIHAGYQKACWLSRASSESTPVGYLDPFARSAALAAGKTLAAKQKAK